MAQFLDLPLEIRLQIYAHLILLSPRYTGERKPLDNSESSKIHPAILSVCRQIHFETLPILYSQNLFIAHPKLLTSFPKLRPWNSASIAGEASVPGLRMVKKWWLVVRLDCGPFWGRETVTRAFTGMDEVVVQVTQSDFGGSGYDNLSMFEGVRGVKRARVFGSIYGFEGYVRWLERSMRTPQGGEVVKYVEGDI